MAESPLESVKSLVGFGPVRCRDCDLRFSEAVLWLPGLRFARCPKCFREDLNEWAEKYFYPPWYKTMLVYVGAKRHRCSKCRYNFVSFFPRKSGPSASSQPPKPPIEDSTAKVSDTVNSEI
jgi:hypothetical protein